jgi:anti-sigma regulatory factor (Ser/Thr protein kinase)
LTLRKTELWRKGFLKDVLRSVTEGKLRVCSSEQDLPGKLETLAGKMAIEHKTLRKVRLAASSAAFSLGFDNERAVDLCTAISEAAMNALVHAGGGDATVYSSPTGTIQVWIEDNGCGIDLGLLPGATLKMGFSTAGTLGHGFFLMLRCIDRIYLLTGPTGTTVVLEKDKIEPRPEWFRQ